MKPHLFLLALVATAVLFDTAQAEGYRIGPGDELEISVFGHEDMSGGYTVSGTGDISMPLIGSVRAADLTGPELEQRIVDALEPDYLKNPRVSIEVLNYRPFYILGEVKAPGSYPYVNGMTYINAVAIAGGYTYRAKKNHAVVERASGPEGAEVRVEMSDLVQPGDIIRIKERFF